jgi:hypothetical protein
VNKETVDVSVSKIWDDEENQDGKRPESITVNLMNGDKVVESKTITEADEWKWTFEGVDKYDDDGEEIGYTVEEAEVNDNYYTTDITGNMDDGFIITNSHTPGTVNVSVSKTWDDADNQDGIRPTNITVQLLANGEEVAGKTLVLNDGNQWKGTFTDLPEYQDGEKITYTIKETDVNGYVTAIIGNAEEGFIITNRHTPMVATKYTNPSDPSKLLKITKTVIKRVKTGDNSRVLLWMALVVVAGCGLAGALVFKKKRTMK